MKFQGVGLMLNMLNNITKAFNYVYGKWSKCIKLQWSVSPKSQ